MESKGFDFPKSYVLMSVLFQCLASACCTLLFWVLGFRRTLWCVLVLTITAASVLSVILYNRRHGRPALFGCQGFGLVLFYDDRAASIPDLEGFDLSMRAYLAALGLCAASYVASLFVIPIHNWNFTLVLLPLFLFIYMEAVLAFNNLRKERPPFCGQVRFFKALAENQL